MEQEALGVMKLMGRLMLQLDGTVAQRDALAARLAEVEAELAALKAPAPEAAPVVTPEVASA